QVHPDRVIEGDRVHHLDLHLHVVVGVLFVLEVAGRVRDLDTYLLEGAKDPEHLLRFSRLEVWESVENVVRGKETLLLTLYDQDLGLLDQQVLESRFHLVFGLSQTLSPTPVLTSGRTTLSTPPREQLPFRGRPSEIGRASCR